MEMADGSYVTSHKLALKRLREYVGYAERGDKTGLMVALEKHTLDDDAHPNAIIYEACRLIVGMTRAQGRSALPLVDMLIEDFSKPARQKPAGGLVLP